jgi:hypothetical protein
VREHEVEATPATEHDDAEAAFVGSGYAAH